MNISYKFYKTIFNIISSLIKRGYCRSIDWFSAQFLHLKYFLVMSCKLQIQRRPVSWNIIDICPSHEISRIRNVIILQSVSLETRHDNIKKMILNGWHKLYQNLIQLHPEMQICVQDTTVRYQVGLIDCRHSQDQDQPKHSF